MTIEQAVYFRTLLLCGNTEELDIWLDTALRDQEPLSEIVLSLSVCGGREKEVLSALNAYILSVPEYRIQYDAVFQMLLSFLRDRYYVQKQSMDTILDLMHRLAAAAEQYDTEPWLTLYYMETYYEEAACGCIDMEDFRQKFHAFLQNGEGFSAKNVPSRRKTSPFFCLQAWFRRHKK